MVSRDMTYEICLAVRVTRKAIIPFILSILCLINTTIHSRPYARERTEFAFQSYLATARTATPQAGILNE